MNKYDNKEKIEQRIYEIMETLGITRMPSCSEIREIEGNEDLINAIRRLMGGLFKTAKQLGLEVKRSSTERGFKYELYIKELLEKQGHIVEKMSTLYPYDLLVDGQVRIDVKASKKYTNPRGFSAYTYCLKHKNPTCDLYALVKIDTEEVYIIPAAKLHQTQLTMATRSKYDIYKDRFDYIDKYKSFFEEVM